MKDYSTEERLNEYANSNLDLLIKLDELKEKIRRDDSHSLELMKALECKRRYKNTAMPSSSLISHMRRQCP